MHELLYSVLLFLVERVSDYKRNMFAKACKTVNALSFCFGKYKISFVWFQLVVTIPYLHKMINNTMNIKAKLPTMPVRTGMSYSLVDCLGYG